MKAEVAGDVTARRSADSCKWLSLASRALEAILPCEVEVVVVFGGAQTQALPNFACTCGLHNGQRHEHATSDYLVMRNWCAPLLFKTVVLRTPKVAVSQARCFIRGAEQSKMNVDVVEKKGLRIAVEGCVWQPCFLK